MFKKNLNAAKPPEQSKGLGGNIMTVGTKLYLYIALKELFMLLCRTGTCSTTGAGQTAELWRTICINVPGMIQPGL